MLLNIPIPAQAASQRVPRGTGRPRNAIQSHSASAPPATRMATMLSTGKPLSA